MPTTMTKSPTAITVRDARLCTNGSLLVRMAWMTSAWVIRLSTNLGVGTLEIDVRQQRGAAMAGAGEVDDIQIVLADDAVDVGVDEAQPRRGAPMPEQARLDVLATQRLAQEWVGQQVDLSNGQIVRS